jgi:DMSO/TMAO reductase YedYZ molybdopterin-dependent catalytic subunit
MASRCRSGTGSPRAPIVPGYFGEKHVKWITRIEVADASVAGFYEKQGWGPNFIVPIRSRIDQPYHEEWFSLGKMAGAPIVVKGMGFGGDRGVSRVEVSFDDGASWAETRIDYPGTRLTWALWSHQWRPEREGDYVLTVRATNADGEVQTWDANRPFTSGPTGFHKIIVHVSA